MDETSGGPHKRHFKGFRHCFSSGCARRVLKRQLRPASHVHGRTNEGFAECSIFMLLATTCSGWKMVGGIFALRLRGRLCNDEDGDGTPR